MSDLWMKARDAFVIAVMAASGAGMIVGVCYLIYEAVKGCG